MTMTKFIRSALILMLAVLMVVSIAACGKDDSAASGSGTSSDASAGDAGNTAEQGKTETWGNITVAVPEGMKLTGGSALDAEDPNAVTLQKEDNAFHYFQITINDDEENAVSGIEMTREVNEGSKDVTIDAGTQWKGVTYEYSGLAVFSVYGTVDGKTVVVMSYGFDPDSDTTKAVLGSLKIAAE